MHRETNSVYTRNFNNFIFQIQSQNWTPKSAYIFPPLIGATGEIFRTKENEEKKNNNRNKQRRWNKKIKRQQNSKDQWLIFHLVRVHALCGKYVSRIGEFVRTLFCTVSKIKEALLHRENGIFREIGYVSISATLL